MTRARLTVREKEMYLRMVDEELEPISTMVESVKERSRIQVEERLKRKLGLVAAFKKKKKLQAQLDELNQQIDRIVLAPGSTYHRGNRFYEAKSVFGKEVAAAMTQLNGVVAEFEGIKKKAERAIWLADAPGVVATLIEGLGKKTAALNGKLVKKLKALPEPQQTDDGTKEDEY